MHTVVLFCQPSTYVPGARVVYIARFVRNRASSALPCVELGWGSNPSERPRSRHGRRRDAVAACRSASQPPASARRQVFLQPSSVEGLAVAHPLLKGPSNAGAPVPPHRTHPETT